MVRDAADLLGQLSEPLAARVLASRYGAETSNMKKSEGSTRLFIVKQDDTADIALFIGICSFYGIAQAFDRGKAVRQLQASLYASALLHVWQREEDRHTKSSGCQSWAKR